MSAPVKHLEERVRDPSDSLAKIMPAAITLAMMLRHKNMAAWLRTEFDGYAESVELLPYRRNIPGHIVARSPQYGWIPAPVSAQQTRDLAHLDLRDGVTDLEETCMGCKKGSGNKIPIAPEQMAALQAQINLSAELAIIISRDAYSDLLHTIRSTIYLWTTDLIELGIGGERNAFKEDEKIKAAPFDDPQRYWKRALDEEADLPVPGVKSAGFFERMFGRTG